MCCKTEGVGYYSLSTALSFVVGTTPTKTFIVSFGNSPNSPISFFHKHIEDTNVNSFSSGSPFPLESILVECNTKKIVCDNEAKEDIAGKTIHTYGNPYEVFEDSSMIIRLAYLAAFTGYTIPEEIKEAAKERAPLLLTENGAVLWRELKLLLCANTPSIGFNFLRDIGALELILPELQRCVGVEQNPKYHKYTVYEHLVKACDAAEPNIVLRTAALLHDIGKPDVKKVTDKGATFYKHDVAGTKKVRKIMSRLKVPKNIAKEIIDLVSLHMYQYDRVWKNATVLRFARKAGITKDYVGRMHEVPLFKLRDYDRMGRDLNPITKKQQDFEHRLEELLSKE